MKNYLTNMVSAIPLCSQAGVVIRRLKAEGIQLSVEEQELKSPFVLGVDADNLQLSIVNLTYGYHHETDTQEFRVGPISEKFSAPQLVFITGRNGAGKTTFIKVLSGLYTGASGALEINGITINEQNREAYRELFSVIFTVPFVFDQLEPASEEEPVNSQNACKARKVSKIEAYLLKLQLSHKVDVKNNRLIRGQLSHGQEKRLALLALYMEDRPILIFDEWAENQDPAFKDLFYRGLLQELRDRNKLVFVVSHEAQYFDCADKILTLEQVSGPAAGVMQL